MAAARISKRKLAHPMQSPQNMGYDNPEDEARARRPRYMNITMEQLLANNAPINLWSYNPPPPRRPPIPTPPSPPSSTTTTSSITSGDNKVPEIDAPAPVKQAGITNGTLSPAHDQISSDPSSAAASSAIFVDKPLDAIQQKKFALYLSRIETRNDRAIRGKKNNGTTESRSDTEYKLIITLPSSTKKPTSKGAAGKGGNNNNNNKRSPKSMSVSLATNTKGNNEPKTPSSLPPRNTIPRNQMPDYIPPGRRGSRVSSNNSVGEGLPATMKRTNSATTASTGTITATTNATAALNSTRRGGLLSRSNSADKPVTVNQADADVTVPLDNIPAASVTTTTAPPRRGRPPGIKRTLLVKPPSPPGSVPTSPIIIKQSSAVQQEMSAPTSPSIASGAVSTSTSTSAFGSGGEDSFVDDDEEEDNDFEDEEDGNYRPPSSHHRKAAKEVAALATAGASPKVRGVRKLASTKQANIDASSAVMQDSVISGNTALPVIPFDASGSSSRDHTSTAPNVINEKKRPHSSIGEIDGTITADAPSSEPPLRKIKIGRPLTLTLAKSNLTNTIPRTHSPLSQSFFNNTNIQTEAGAANGVVSGRGPAPLSVS